MAKKEIKNSKDKTSFIKGFKAELKKVSWPTLKQLFNNTVAVLVIVVVTAVIVFILDITFESINKYGIDKIKEKVSNSISNEVDETSKDDEMSNEVSETENEANETSDDVSNNEAVTE